MVAIRERGRGKMALGEGFLVTVENANRLETGLHRFAPWRERGQQLGHPCPLGRDGATGLGILRPDQFVKDRYAFLAMRPQGRDRIARHHAASSSQHNNLAIPYPRVSAHSVGAHDSALVFRPRHKRCITP